MDFDYAAGRLSCPLFCLLFSIELWTSFEDMVT